VLYITPVWSYAVYRWSSVILGFLFGFLTVALYKSIF